MVPEGVRVVSAFHTVSAALLTDLDHELDEDVLICGDRREDKAKVAELVDDDAGLRPVDCGAARDGTDRRAADAADHLDQRAQQGPRGDQDHGPGRTLTAAAVAVAFGGAWRWDPTGA